ncbi:MAG: hypothetical protein LBN34_04630 [Clostridiales Family XIII bacterium]|jgi:glucan phosphoethanolaminetransferase (alkaline phosphatase superfamily)|nr:hypothetical protein [Clostridiales Family XIII bacterium]
MSIVTINLIWIVGVVGGIALLLIGLRFHRRVLDGIGIGLVILSIILSVVLYFNFTAAGEQTVKSWNAQSVGIYREIEIYSMTGELIDSYKGKVNIEYNDNEVNIYDVEKKSRMIIYYKNGTVVVKEPNAEEE